MDLRQIRYFIGIVDSGSLTAAARQLHVAQPALSQHLKRLEEDAGQPLLHRTRRGIVPTEAGSRLYERGKAILGQMEDLRQDLRREPLLPRGAVSIGIPTSLGAVLSVPLARAVRQQFPEVRLRVVEGLSGHTLEWLRAGQLDLALVFGERLAGMTARRVATEDLRLVAAAGDARLAGLRAQRPDGAVPLRAVAGLPLILPGRPHGVREEVELAARRLGLALDVVLEMDALDNIKALVAAGVGYTVLSGRVAHGGHVEGLTSAPVVEPAITRTIQLAHVADRPLSNAAQAVDGLVMRHLAALTREGRWRDDA